VTSAVRIIHLVVLIVLIGACNTRPVTPTPDQADPTLLILLESETRTTTRSEIVVLGAVGSDALERLSYTLNGSAPQDITAAVKDGAFSVTVGGLELGTNILVLSATDEAGRSASARMSVERVASPPGLPQVEGVWSDDAPLTNACATATSLTLMFDAPQASGAVTGLWTLAQDGHWSSAQAAGSFAGTLSADGRLTGTASLDISARPERYDLDLRVGAEAITGTLTSQSPVACHDRPAAPTTYQVALARFTDDAFQPNSSAATATPVASGFAHDLKLRSQDEDWFRLELASHAIVTLVFLPDENAPLFLALLDADLEPLSQVGHAPSQEVGLAPGTYYLKVGSQSLRNSAYRLALTTRPPPDAALEPNDTFATATPMSLPYTNARLHMGLVDEDWFRFTLAQAQVVTLASDISASFEIIRDAQTTVHGGWGSGGATVWLEAGTYRLRFFGAHEASRPYSLSVSSRTPGDAGFEPNDTRATATAITLPFARSELFASDRDTDWYRFTLERPATVEIALSHHWGYLTPAAEEWNLTPIGTGPTVLELPADDYYLQVQGHVGAFYSLSIAPQ
jgi:hypothetical protein